MKTLLVLLAISIVIACQSNSECFGDRKIVKRTQLNVKFVVENDSILIDKSGKKYVACNYPDTLYKNQNYTTRLNLFEVKPHEKWIAHPCKIRTIISEKDQTFEILEIGESYLFLGGGLTGKGKQETVGITITKKSDRLIDYEIIELIDWKVSNKVIGVADFQKSNNDKIETQEDKFESAYRFIDSENNIEILISKSLRQPIVRAVNLKNRKQSYILHKK